MRVSLTAFALGTLISGCVSHDIEWKQPPAVAQRAADQSELAAVREAIAYRMRDPGSTNVRNVYVATGPEGTTTDGTYICGQYNARNAFGGYVGFKQFWAIKTAAGPTQVLEVDNDRADVRHICRMFGLAVPK